MLDFRNAVCQIPEKSEFIIGLLDFPNELLPVNVDLCRLTAKLYRFMAHLCRFMLIESPFMSIYADL